MAETTDFTLGVDLDVTDALKTVDQLDDEIKKIFESRQGKEGSSRLTSVELQIKRTYQQIRLLQDSIRSSVQSFSEMGYDTQNYSDAIILFQKLNSAYNELTQAREQARETGQAEVQGEIRSLEEIEEGILHLETILPDLKDRINAEAILDANNDRVKQLIIRYQELARAEQGVSDMDGAEATALQSVIGNVRTLGNMIPGVEHKFLNGLSNIISGVIRLSKVTGTQLMGAVNALKAAVLKLFALIAAHPVVALLTAILIAIMAIIGAVKKLYDKTKEQLEKLAELLKKGFADLLQKSRQLIILLIKDFIKLGTLVPRALIKGVQLLINKLMSLKSVVMENIQLMAKWNKGNNAVNTALSNITSSLNYLKASLATVVAPILVTIEPIITKIVDRLAEMVTFIGMIIAKLTGATSFQKAIRKQKDYAKSLEETNGQLASFDKLNNIDEKKGEGVDFGMYDLQNFKLPDWLKDFYALGRKIGQMLRDFLNKIPWTNIQKMARQAAKAIADFINGFISVEGLGDSIGRTMGEVLNTVSAFVNRFLQVLDGRSLGRFLGDIFETMIETVRWDELGSMFSNAVNELMDIIIGFNERFDGSTLGTSLTEFFQNSVGKIDWVKIRKALNDTVNNFTEMLNELITPKNFGLIGTTLAQVLTTIFDGVKTFTDGVDWPAWGESIGTAINNFFKDTDWKLGAQAIGSVATGLLDTLLAAIRKINWDGTQGNGSYDDSVVASIIEFLGNIPWEDIANKAKEISGRLRTGFNTIWEALKKSGIVDDIASTIADILSEKELWEAMFKSVKQEVIRKVVLEKIKNFFEMIGSAILTLLLKAVVNSKGNISGATGGLSGGANIFNATPGFATGGVIPPYASEHLIRVGDNNVETEVVSPLSTIEQALRNVMAEQNINVTFQVQGDPNGIFKVVQEQSNKFTRRTGLSAFT